METSGIFFEENVNVLNAQRISELGRVRSAELFENMIEIPLSEEESKRIKSLDFFKRWYLVCHVCYMLTVVFIGSCLLKLFEGDAVDWVDALFVSMSAVCNCGLQTVNISTFSTASHVLRHLLMLLGGVVLTSMYQPFFRIFLISRVKHIFAPHESDSFAVSRFRALKMLYAERLRVCAIISVSVTLLYFVSVNFISIVLLMILNRSSLDLLQVCSITLTAFHGCVFSSLEFFDSDPSVVLVVATLCALGFTAFPVFLRSFFRFAAFCVHICLRARILISDRRTTDSNELAETEEAEENDTLLQSATTRDGADLCVAKDKWALAFEDILTSRHPGSFHSFLFLEPECAFLGVAWLGLTLFQSVPFWFEQWHGALKAYGPFYKVFLSLCQSASVRFAAATFVPIHNYSNAHIAVTIMCMYIPALPISTDRTYKKWKEMFRTSLFRLLTSRLFWLFTAMLSILFAEEDVMRPLISGTRFDIMTRVFFEVISAYSGCGHSLSIERSDVSFVGSLSSFSKIVIVFVLLGGRHRFVDLGIDLGLDSLQEETRLNEP